MVFNVELKMLGSWESFEWNSIKFFSRSKILNIFTAFGKSIVGFQCDATF